MKTLIYILKKSFLFILILFSIVSVSGCRHSKIEWMDFLKFDDITYYAVDYLIEDELDYIELGDVYKTVKHKVADVVFNINYKAKNGDAARYTRGTKVYSIIGYKTAFRLAVKTGMGIMLYEAVKNPNASIGADMLDLVNKVEYITLNSGTDRESVIVKIDNKTDVEKIINFIINSPIDDDIQITSDDKYYINFYFKDGTSTKRTYRVNDGELGKNIRIPEEMTDMINSYLGK
jgi:hypothetical protein